MRETERNFCKTRNGKNHSLVGVACTRMPLFACPELAAHSLCICIMLLNPEPCSQRMFLRIAPICANSSCCFFLFFTPPSTRSCQSRYIIVFFIDRKPREKEKQKQTRLTQLTHPSKLPTLAPPLVLTEVKKEIASGEREKRKAMRKNLPRFVAPAGNL